LLTSRHVHGAKTFGREGQQLGNGLDIPVGKPDFDVTEIGGQFRQLSFDIESGPIPLNEALCREAMPIMPISALAALD